MSEPCFAPATRVDECEACGDAARVAAPGPHYTWVCPWCGQRNVSPEVPAAVSSRYDGPIS